MQEQRLESRQTKIFNAFPAITLLFAIIVSQSWPTGHFEIIPDFMVAIVYYWSVFRPAAPLAVTFFGMGFLEDILMGTPMGFTSTIWLGIYFATITQRSFLVEKSFLIVWVGFFFVAFIAYALKTGLLYYMTDLLVPLMPVFFSYLLSVALYPLVARIVSLFNRYLHV